MAEGKLVEKLIYEEVPLETLLLNRKLVTSEQLKYALSLAGETNEGLAETLIAEEMVSGVNVYNALADHLNSQYIDLKKNLCEKDLLVRDDLFKYIKYNFLPWRMAGSITLVAVTGMCDRLFLYLRLKYPSGFRVIYTTPQNIVLNIQRSFGDVILDVVKRELKVVDKACSSATLFSRNQKVIFIKMLCCFLFSVFALPGFIFRLFVVTANIVFLLNVFFKIAIFFRGAKKESTSTILSRENLPIYTILLPIYKEGLVIEGLLRSMRSLDYPKNKLDIVIIVEQFDRETISFLKKQNYDGLFRVICVPKSDPKTKPKACSYALKFAKGEYLTIYDAEDRPEPDQLLKAVNVFRNEAKDVACLQAKLFCVNFKETMLSFLFSVEYLIWFGFFLKGLERFNMPIPLGGNSNHFKTEILKCSGSWDPYNVTEDADIGYRIAKNGYRTKILDSITWEEAPIDLKTWLNQRSRWIKGHMQTYIVHLRDLDKFNLSGAVGFYGFLILPIITYFLQVILIVSGVFLGDSDFDLLIKYITVTNLAAWIIMSIAFAWIAVTRSRWKGAGKAFIALYPFYYLLHSISAIIALYQIIFKTHYWSKTMHHFDDRERYKLKERGLT